MRDHRRARPTRRRQAEGRLAGWITDVP